MVSQSISQIEETSFPTNRACAFVDRILWFGYWETAPCCVPVTKGRAPRYSNTSNLTQMGPRQAANELLSRRRHLGMNLKANPPLACANCRYLEAETHEEGIRQKFSGVVLSHAELCDLRCIYCYQSASEYRVVSRQIYSPLPIINELCKMNLFQDQPYAFWGGGEPTLSLSFEEESLKLEQLGFYQTINSNCTRYSPHLVELLGRGEHAAVVCSIDSGSKKTYEKVKGRDRWNQVWDNLRIYLEASEHVVLKYIVMPENKDEIDAFLQKAIGIGCTKFLVDLDCGLAGNYSDPDTSTLQACLSLVEHIEKLGLQIGWAGNALNTLGDRDFIGWLLTKSLPQPWIYSPFSQLAGSLSNSVGGKQ